MHGEGRKSRKTIGHLGVPVLLCFEISSRSC
jgi:hypothetical protein